MHNYACLVGRLTRSPESKTIGNTMLATFSIALNEYWKDKNGDKQESTLFMDCEAWGKQAEFATMYLNKGGLILVEGKLKQDTWESKEGEKRSKIKLRVNGIRMLSAKGRDDESQVEPEAPAGKASNVPDDMDDQIPF